MLAAENRSQFPEMGGKSIFSQDRSRRRHNRILPSVKKKASRRSRGENEPAIEIDRTSDLAAQEGKGEQLLRKKKRFPNNDTKK